MAAEMNLVPELSFRGPGCTDACQVLKALIPGRFGRSELLLHDPTSHEEYGQITAGPMGESVVWTGSLVIDRLRRAVVSHGREVDLTRREWEILDYLAAHAGIMPLREEIAEAVFGLPRDLHPLRVHMARLRDKLGENGRLIETRFGYGYRLAMVAPIEVVPEFIPRRQKPWALAWPFCVCCGKTERPHVAHGRCSRCRGGGSTRHHGPCGAPNESNVERLSTIASQLSTEETS